MIENTEALDVIKGINRWRELRFAPVTCMADKLLVSDLAIALMKEEVLELRDAMRDSNKIEILDAIGDIAFVAINHLQYFYGSCSNVQVILASYLQTIETDRDASPIVLQYNFGYDPMLSHMTAGLLHAHETLLSVFPGLSFLNLIKIILASNNTKDVPIEPHKLGVKGGLKSDDFISPTSMLSHYRLGDEIFHSFLAHFNSTMPLAPTKFYRDSLVNGCPF